MYYVSIFLSLAKKKVSLESVATAQTAVKQQLIEEAAQMVWYFTTLYRITECSVAPDSTHIGVGHHGVVMGRQEVCKKGGGDYLKPLIEIRQDYCKF